MMMNNYIIARKIQTAQAFSVFNVAQRLLYDIRDNNKYTVRKLADGNCWMTSNLNFALEANKTYTGVNNTTGKEISFSTDNVCEDGGACVMNGNTVYNATYSTWYYSWYAATANSGKYADVRTDALYSICPAAWRLPPNYSISAYNQKSYGAMTNTYGMTSNGKDNTNNNVKKLEGFPFGFYRTGFALSESISYYDQYGYYTSSTAALGPTHSFQFFYGENRTSPAADNFKRHGYIVRCVAL